MESKSVRTEVYWRLPGLKSAQEAWKACVTVFPIASWPLFYPLASASFYYFAPAAPPSSLFAPLFLQLFMVPPTP
jgi:hypothetical protein